MLSRAETTLFVTIGTKLLSDATKHANNSCCSCAVPLSDERSGSFPGTKKMASDTKYLADWTIAVETNMDQCMVE